jgi:hypothetical protein
MNRQKSCYFSEWGAAVGRAILCASFLIAIFHVAFAQAPDARQILKQVYDKDASRNI